MECCWSWIRMEQKTLLSGVQLAFTIFSRASAQNDVRGSGAGDTANVLLRNDLGKRAYRMFANLKTIETYMSCCMRVVRLDAIMTGVFSSFRAVQLSGDKSCIKCFKEDLISGASGLPIFIEASAKHDQKGGCLSWDSASHYCAILSIAASPVLIQVYRILNDVIKQREGRKDLELGALAAGT